VLVREAGASFLAPSAELVAVSTIAPNAAVPPSWSGFFSIVHPKSRFTMLAAARR